MRLNTVDANMLFAKWYPWQKFLDTIKLYPRVHGTRVFLLWHPGPNRLEDMIDVSPYRYDAKKKRWDLSAWTPEFTAGVKQSIEAFAQAGKYVIVSLVDYCSLSNAGWAEHPWNKKNNLQGHGSDDLKVLKDDFSNDTMSHLWYSLADNLLAAVDEKYHDHLIIEVANEPNFSFFPIEQMTDYLMHAKAIPPDRVWLSVTEGEMHRMRETENKDSMKHADTISVHSIGQVDDMPRICLEFFTKSAYKNCVARPDSDGAKKPGGGWLSTGPHNLTAMKPVNIHAIVEKYGQLGLILHSDDKRHTPAQWAATWKFIKPILEAF